MGGVTWAGKSRKPRTPKAASAAEDDADHAARRGEERRLQQELAPDVALARAERQAHADLAGALHHRDQHDVHDHDPADAERDRRR